MYPVLFHIGTFEVTTFGALVALAALAGLAIFRREALRGGLPEYATDAAIAGVMGGLAGAKLLWVAEHLGEEPVLSLLTSRAGMSWFGGVFGGVAAGLVVMKRHHLSVMAVLAAAAPAMAIGHAIGRIGCFLVGDDYGRPTTLPWGVAFPLGAPPTDVPVHPTQLYEAIALMPIAWWLFRWRRQQRSDAQVLGLYLLLTAVLRFLIEFIRVNERVALGLTVAQWAAILLALVGSTLLWGARRVTVPRAGSAPKSPPSAPRGRSAS